MRWLKAKRPVCTKRGLGAVRKIAVGSHADWFHGLWPALERIPGTVSDRLNRSLILFVKGCETIPF
jgi:hypothetical protein